MINLSAIKSRWARVRDEGWYVNESSPGLFYLTAKARDGERMQPLVACDISEDDASLIASAPADVFALLAERDALIATHDEHVRELQERVLGLERAYARVAKERDESIEALQAHAFRADRRAEMAVEACNEREQRAHAAAIAAAAGVCAWFYDHAKKREREFRERGEHRAASDQETYALLAASIEDEIRTLAPTPAVTLEQARAEARAEAIAAAVAECERISSAAEAEAAEIDGDARDLLDYASGASGCAAAIRALAPTPAKPASYDVTAAFTRAAVAARDEAIDRAATIRREVIDAAVDVLEGAGVDAAVVQRVRELRENEYAAGLARWLGADAQPASDDAADAARWRAVRPFVDEFARAVLAFDTMSRHDGRAVERAQLAADEARNRLAFAALDVAKGGG